MRTTHLVFISLLFFLVIHAGEPLRLKAEGEDATSAEAWENAEKAHAEKCKAEDMVEHKGVFVPKEWFERCGTMNQSALEKERRQEQEKNNEERRKGRQEFMDKLNKEYDAVLFDAKYAPHDPGRAIDVVIVGDGFTRGEISRFASAALRVMGLVTKADPLNQFAPMFNFYVVGVVSEQSGVSSTKGGKLKTAFGVTIGEDKIAECDYSKARKYARIEGIEAELVLVLANTQRSSSVASLETSGAGVMVVTLATQLDKELRRRFGLAFGKLGNEEFNECPKCRDQKPGSEPPYPNLTIESDPKKCKWNYWIETGRGRVGLYDQTQQYREGLYRPASNCLMREGSEFCPVCMEVMMVKCFGNVDVVKAVSPESAYVLMGSGDSQIFQAAMNSSAGSNCTETWFVDGKQACKGGKFLLNASSLEPGRHVVALSMAFSSKYVLRGEEYLERAAFWEVEVLPFPKPRLEFPSVALRAKVGELLEVAIKDLTSKKGEKRDYEIECLNLPEGAQFDAEGPALRWRPHTWQRGARVLQFRVIAGAMNEIYSLTINVIDPGKSANNKPIIRQAPDQKVLEGSSLSFTVTADDLDYDNVALSADDVPEGANFDPVTGRFSWVPNFMQAGEYDVVFKAHDGVTLDSLKVRIEVSNRSSQALNFKDIMALVENGQRGRMRDVEYGLWCAGGRWRESALREIAKHYGAAALLECARFMKSKDERLPEIAASRAIELAGEKVGAGDDELVKFMLEKIAACFDEQRLRCEKLKDLLEKIQGNEKLTESTRRAAEILLKRLG